MIVCRSIITHPQEAHANPDTQTCYTSFWVGPMHKYLCWIAFWVFQYLVGKLLISNWSVVCRCCATASKWTRFTHVQPWHYQALLCLRGCQVSRPCSGRCCILDSFGDGWHLPYAHDWQGAAVGGLPGSHRCCGAIMTWSTLVTPISSSFCYVQRTTTEKTPKVTTASNFIRV